MYLLHRHVLAEISQNLSTAMGCPIRIGGLWGGWGPSLLLTDIQVGGPKPIITVSRVEVELDTADLLSPSLREIRLVQPSVSIDASDLSLVPSASPTSRRHIRPASAHRPRWQLVIQDGSFNYSVLTDSGPAQLSIKGISLQPTQPHQARLLLGKTVISVGQHELLVINAGALDLRLQPAISIDRLATLGGSIWAPGLLDRPLALDQLTLLTDQRIPRHEYSLQVLISDERAGGFFRITALLDRSFRLASDSAVKLHLKRMALARIRPLIQRAGITLSQGRIDGVLSLNQNQERFQLRSNLTLQELVFSHPHLADRPLGPLDSTLAGEMFFSLSQKELLVRHLTLSSKKAQLALRGSLHAGQGMSLEVMLPPLPCQALLQSLPHSLIPQLEGLALSGEIGLRGKLQLELAALDATQVRLDFSPLSCKVLVDPPLADVHMLRRPFSIQIRGPHGEPRSWWLGHDNPSYSSLTQISSDLQTAFIVAEDAHFYRHQGFDADQLQRAFVNNLKRGATLRGASTISQQLVKNVFFSPARTLSRKLQEAVLTWRMEQVISKSRILELYLNLVEMGPGIYGVGQAARHYFATSAVELPAWRAAQLAALAPNPRQLAPLLRENTSAGWKERVRIVFRLLQQRNRVHGKTPAVDQLSLLDVARKNK